MPRFRLTKEPPIVPPALVRPKGSTCFMTAYVDKYGNTSMRALGPGQLTILWDEKSSLMMIEGQMLRDVRTGSVGALGSKYLARPDSHKLGVIGSGNQATNGLFAHAVQFDIRECKVYSPTTEHRDAL